jgi:hypothetical protein
MLFFILALKCYYIGYMSDEDLTGKVGDGASTKDAGFFEELVNSREKFDDYVYFSSMEELKRERL